MIQSEFYSDKEDDSPYYGFDRFDSNDDDDDDDYLVNFQSRFQGKLRE